jgi:hypothetical protein
MTPQERQLVEDLFDRVARLESTPRDPEAERIIADGLRRAPHAVYALVQTVLVQDEALKRAEARLRELAGDDQAPHESAGFLDSMRELLTGRRTSVPSVGNEASADTRWNAGASPSRYAPPAAPTPGAGLGGGGSFLGTAAATAAGVIGGSMLFNSLGSMFGNHSGSALADTSQQHGSPWGNEGGGNLANEAGANDVGSSGQGAFDDQQSAGLLEEDFGDGGDFGGDFGDSDIG